MSSILSVIDPVIFFVGIFYPGTIAIITYRLFVPKTIDWKNILLESIFYGGFTCLLLAPAAQALKTNFESDISYYYFIFFLFTLIPILLSLGTYKLRTLQSIKKFIVCPETSAWDFYFSQRRSCFIKIKLSDGTMIGGYYGPNSFSNHSQKDCDIFMQWAYNIDDNGNFCDVCKGSGGIYVKQSSIIYMEIIQAEEEM